MNNNILEQNKIEFTRINNDVNGNPRYVCHFYALINENDRHCTEGWGINQTSVLYDIAVKRANKIGGRKYHNKQYGGGIVFQSYSLPELEKAINEAKNS
jgi:hypothetical protein